MVETGQPCYDSAVAFTRWDPLRDLLALQEQIGQLVGTDAPGWTPPVDLYETAGAFVLTAELPGLPREAIEIHVEESRIVIRGERPGGSVPCEQYHRVERGHGRFSRTFLLPEPTEVDGVSADLKDGLLTVTIPKAGGRGSRRVSVS
jgi:HSP20 family protein